MLCRCNYCFGFLEVRPCYECSKGCDRWHWHRECWERFILELDHGPMGVRLTEGAGI
jgi:hypothetical protein